MFLYDSMNFKKINNIELDIAFFALKNSILLTENNHQTFFLFLIFKNILQPFFILEPK